MSNAKIKLGGLYEQSTFDKSLLPTWVNKELREVVETAVMLGWKMHLSTANSITIVSFDERKRYHFNVGGRSSTPMNRIKRDVFKFADPKKLLVAEAAMGSRGTPLSKTLLNALPEVGDEGTVVDHRAEDEAAREAREQQRLEAARKREAEPETTEPDVSIESKPGPHIVTEKPMRASSGSGRAYDSLVTLERLWSDGSKDYKCAKCDFTSPVRQAVSGHNAKAHGAALPGGGKPERYFAEVPDATPYAPRGYRVEALAESLATYEGQTLTIDVLKDLAREALIWSRNQMRTGTPLSDDAEPRTAEETLARIRTLLDNGTTARLRQANDDLEAQLLASTQRAEEAEATLAERLAEAEAAIQAADARAEAADRRADQARSTLRAFMDLAKDLDTGHEADAS